MADLGFGYYDEDVRIAGLDHDAVDLNIHWFSISHLEVILMNRLSAVGLGPGAGGQWGGWSMIQLHYRL
jgi:hypothetical protein